MADKFLRYSTGTFTIRYYGTFLLGTDFPGCFVTVDLVVAAIPVPEDAGRPL